MDTFLGLLVVLGLFVLIVKLWRGEMKRWDDWWRSIWS